eukprot:1316980-Amphidinium_carterae.1
MFDGVVDDDVVTVDAPNFGSSDRGSTAAEVVEDDVSDASPSTPGSAGEPPCKLARLGPQVTLGHVALERLRAATSSSAARVGRDAVTEFVCAELARTEMSRLPGLVPLPWEIGLAGVVSGGAAMVPFALSTAMPFDLFEAGVAETDQRHEDETNKR